MIFRSFLVILIRFSHIPICSIDSIFLISSRRSISSKRFLISTRFWPRHDRFHFRPKNPIPAAPPDFYYFVPSYLDLLTPLSTSRTKTVHKSVFQPQNDNLWIHNFSISEIGEYTQIMQKLQNCQISQIKKNERPGVSLKISNLKIKYPRRPVNIFLGSWRH